MRSTTPGKEKKKNQLHAHIPKGKKKKKISITVWLETRKRETTQNAVDREGLQGSWQDDSSLFCNYIPAVEMRVVSFL